MQVGDLEFAAKLKNCIETGVELSRILRFWNKLIWFYLVIRKGKYGEKKNSL